MGTQRKDLRKCLKCERKSGVFSIIIVDQLSTKWIYKNISVCQSDLEHVLIIHGHCTH